MVLNPQLYNSLKAIYREVGTSSAGIAYKYVIENGKLRDLVKGEQYTIKCPICNDHKKRLTISHINGTRPPGFKEVVKNKFRCFNCNFSPKEDPEGLERIVSGYYKQLVSGMKVTLEQAVQPLTPLEDPGELGSIVKDSAGYSYLVKRNLVPELVERLYGVKIILKAKKRFLQDRLYFPMYDNGTLCAWQARDVYNVYDSHDHRYLPWYKGIGGKSSIFNLNLAASKQFIVICEGVFDAMTVGQNAVAVLGKTIDTYQAKQLARANKPLVIALDADVSREEVLKFRRTLLLHGVIRPIYVVQYPEDWPIIFNERKNKYIKADANEVGSERMHSLIKESIRGHHL